MVAEVEGERLTHDEVRTMVGNLIVAGHDTTGSQLGCTFLTLLRHPDQAALLASEPDLLPHAVEETMRFEPSISGIPRTPTEPIVVGGEEVPAGHAADPLDRRREPRARRVDRSRHGRHHTLRRSPACRG